MVNKIDLLFILHNKCLPMHSRDNLNDTGKNATTYTKTEKKIPGRY